MTKKKKLPFYNTADNKNNKIKQQTCQERNSLMHRQKSNGTRCVLTNYSLPVSLS